MKKWCICLAVSAFLTGFTVQAPARSLVQQQEPEYAKWSRIAIQEAKRKYPDAKLIDYLYIGRETQNSQIKEKFKLWVRQGNREFGLYVTLELDQQGQKVNKVVFRETDR
ncbi:DUF3889 domain-containing protein [Bacillus mangrovi]|uniref:DUF3889 domain-containing protein n=1 Tax=Metabacillus mangrovi TaxID=1491830 RepID=A0A7X2V4U3_9BACI|nr:DUF3889 domain-containing protein [Metabacillus mangrovi]MTH53476.1 DUF3889 domain-containing protein [Metabacillus mangrovi]